jgi:anti-sigma B factor antagonist
MQLDDRIVGDVAVVTVSGEITLKRNRSTMLHDKVRSVLQQGHKKVLVDLAGVSFVDSAGLGELVQTNSMVKDQGGALKLSSPAGRLREMLTVTKLTTIVNVYDTEAQALASFGTPPAVAR